MLADAPVEILVCLLGDLLYLFEALRSRLSGQTAKLLVGRIELTRIELSRSVLVVFLEDHVDLLA